MYIRGELCEQVRSQVKKFGFGSGGANHMEDEMSLQTTPVEHHV